MFELIFEFCSFRTLLVIIATSCTVLLGLKLLGLSIGVTLALAAAVFLLGMVWSRGAR